MKCSCGSKTKIIDTREAGKRVVVSLDHKYDNYKKRRRHQCIKCGTRFTTIEVICEIVPPKNPGKRKVKKPKDNNWIEKINRKLQE